MPYVPHTHDQYETGAPQRRAGLVIFDRGNADTLGNPKRYRTSSRATRHAARHASCDALVLVRTLAGG